jgi:hypothetical protein
VAFTKRYEKARTMAGAATEKTLTRWLAHAEEATCVELRREAQAEEKRQMCGRGERRMGVPGRTVRLLADLVGAVRAAEGRWMPAGDCLEVAARLLHGISSLGRSAVALV